MKNQGKFSLKYISNPVQRHRQQNKENKDINGTFDSCELDLHVAVTPEKIGIQKNKITKEKREEKLLLEKMND